MRTTDDDKNFAVSQKRLSGRIHMGLRAKLLAIGTVGIVGSLIVGVLALVSMQASNAAMQKAEEYAQDAMSAEHLHYQVANFDDWLQ